MFKKKRNTLFLDNITCDPSLYKMAHPDFIACSFRENSIGIKRVNVSYTILVILKLNVR